MANVITITALNAYVKSLLESDAVLTDIALRGEISNFTNHFKTGHYYFTLKDEKCSVKAVMFRSYAQELAFMPQNGMRVIVRCRISLFERDGAFQVYVEDMFPDGVGAMQLAFDQLKQKLEREGLFAPEHKKSLPQFPRCIGLVTSKTGAALQDILNVTSRRYPLAHFLLASVTVQGNDAAPGIAQAIKALDESQAADVIIVARGGGSREDLWVFNSELIARAAFACKTPIVSAIGHEIDFSILDFVADLRAPTPSAAAELVMPNLDKVAQNLYAIYTNIYKQMQRRIDLCYNKLQQQRTAAPLIAVQARPSTAAAQLADQRTRLQTLVAQKMQLHLRDLQHKAALCDSLNPYGVLARGYSITRAGDSILKKSSEIAPGARITVQLAQGALACTVDEILQQKENEI